MQVSLTGFSVNLLLQTHLGLLIYSRDVHALQRLSQNIEQLLILCRIVQKVYWQPTRHTTSHWPTTFATHRKHHRLLRAQLIDQFQKVRKSTPRRQISPKTNARWEKVYSLQPYMWRHSSRASALGVWTDQSSMYGDKTYE